jgi:hypothetical protein
MAHSDDAYDRKADHVAEEGIAASGLQWSLPSAAIYPPLQPKFSRAGFGECAECNSEGAIPRPEVAKSADTSAAPPIVHEALRSPSQPLDAETRADMELRFGHDFSQVRVHTDARAEQSAGSLNARAYTVGHDIVFRRSQYDPRSTRGQQLLAHELAHVVQIDLSGIRSDPSHVTPTNHPSEVEARAASQPGPVPVFSAAPDGLALDANDNVMVMPQAEITGLDPNVVRPSGGTIKGREKPDEETQKVMADEAAARTLAITYLNGHKSEIIMAVDAFKGDAQSQIDALDADPSDLTGAVGPLIGVIGTVVSGIFPPAAGFVAGTAFVANMTNASAIAGIKAEGGSVKQSLKNGMQAFATAASNAASAAMAAESNAIPTRLTNLAVSDNNVWNMLAIGGDRQLDDVVTGYLHIPDPAKQSKYGEVLKALMVPFKAWIEKEKYESGKTLEEKMIAESVPGSESFADLHKKIKAGEASAAEQAKKMTEAHLKGSP